MLPFELTKDTPYLALLGELWSVFCEYFNRNWPCYKGFLLYYLYGWGAYIESTNCSLFHRTICMAGGPHWVHKLLFIPLYYLYGWGSTLSPQTTLYSTVLLLWLGGLHWVHKLRFIPLYYFYGWGAYTESTNYSSFHHGNIGKGMLTPHYPLELLVIAISQCPHRRWQTECLRS